MSIRKHKFWSILHWGLLWKINFALEKLDKTDDDSIREKMRPLRIGPLPDTLKTDNSKNKMEQPLL